MPVAQLVPLVGKRHINKPNKQSRDHECRDGQYLDAFSKVSALLHLLCKVTNQRTFQNAYNEGKGDDSRVANNFAPINRDNIAYHILKSQHTVGFLGLRYSGPDF